MLKSKLFVEGKRNQVKHIIRLAILTLFMLAFYILVYKNAIESSYKNKEELQVINKATETSVIKDLENDDVIVQKFKAPIREMSGLSLQFETYGQENNGMIEIMITNKTSDLVIYNHQLDISTINDNVYRQILFDKTGNNENDLIEIQIRVKDISENSKLTLGASQKGTYSNEKLLINGNEQDIDICINAIGQENVFLLVLFNAVSFIIVCSLYFFYYALAIKRMKIENVYLFAAIILGSIYMFVLPPLSAPDEYGHIMTAYLYSNDILGRGTPEEPGYEYIREEDYEAITRLAYKPSASSYKYLYNNMLETEKSDKLIKIPAHKIVHIPYLYLPGALGMAIAMLLSLGSVPMVFIGRFFAMLTFILMTFFGIKKIPFGKSTLFIIALFPITLQQASSFSYDSIINGLAFLLIAYSLHLAFNDKQNSKKDIIIFIIINALLAGSKGGAYIPMCMLTFLIPIYKFGTKKKYFVFLATAVITAVVVYAFFNIFRMSYTPGSVVWSGEESYTLGYFVHNPFRLARIFADTIFVKGDLYFGTMIGSLLGWLNLPVNNFVINAFALLFLLSAVKDKNEAFILSNKNRLLLVFIMLSSYFLIGLSMLLLWTPSSSTVIEGVQGRYFIPFILLLGLLCRNNKIVVQKNITAGLLFSSILLHVFVLYNIINTVI